MAYSYGECLGTGSGSKAFGQTLVLYNEAGYYFNNGPLFSCNVIRAMASSSMTGFECGAITPVYNPVYPFNILYWVVGSGHHCSGANMTITASGGCYQRTAPTNFSAYKVGQYEYPTVYFTGGSIRAQTYTDDYLYYFAGDRVATGIYDYTTSYSNTRMDFEGEYDPAYTTTTTSTTTTSTTSTTTTTTTSTTATSTSSTTTSSTTTTTTAPPVTTPAPGTGWGKPDTDWMGYSTGAVCQAMGGTSPNYSTLRITSIRVLCGIASGSASIRLGVYTGGSLSDPEGATLLWDAGATTVSHGSFNWETITHPSGGVNWPGNTPTWLVAKWSDFNLRAAIESGTPPVIAEICQDFQASRGRYTCPGLGTNPAVAFAATFPDSGTFGNFWVHIYVTYDLLATTTTTTSTTTTSTTTTSTTSTTTTTTTTSTTTTSTTTTTTSTTTTTTSTTSTTTTTGTTSTTGTTRTTTTVTTTPSPPLPSSAYALEHIDEQAPKRYAVSPLREHTFDAVEEHILELHDIISSISKDLQRMEGRDGETPKLYNDMNFNRKRATNLLDPAEDQDAVTLAYLKRWFSAYLADGTLPGERT